MKLINKLTLLIVLLLLTMGSAQDYGDFPYNQPFTSGIKPPELTIPTNSDNVTFNSQGMLLTPAQNTRFGAAYFNNIRFYSPQGIRLEFEYGMYGGNGADGISVFLFDAAVTNPQIGTKGDGLAYNYNRANDRHPASAREPGLTGAYLGIGLDAFGNYKNRVFQGDRRKNGLANTLTNPGNQVTLRGAAGKTSLGNDGRGFGYNGYPVLVTKSTQSGANSGAVLNTNGTYSLTSGTSANFNLGTSALGLTPSSANFRKAYIDLLPNALGGYNVTVKIQHGATTTTVIDNYHYRTSLTYVENANPNSTDFSNSETQGSNSTHTLDATIPEYFRIGFGASTGGFNNNHLIRNLKIMIPYAAEANDDTFAVNCTNNSVNVLTNDLAYTNFSAPTASTNNIYKPSFRFLNASGVAQGHTYTDPAVGTWTYDQATGIVSLAPLASFSGTATVQYDIKGGGPTGTETPFDKEAYRSAHATITANVQICNDPCVISATNPDSDGDGISDACDLDDDNDGILDTDECNSTNRITSGVFPTSGGNTNTLTGWTVGGNVPATGAWAGQGRVHLNSDGISFRRDASTTTTISQALTGVTGGSSINLNNIYWHKTFPTTTAIEFTFTVSYAGVIYATINSTTGNTPTVTASNGAIVSSNSLATVTGTPVINAGINSAKTNLAITLPNVVANSGNLLFTFVAGSDGTEVRDLGMASVSLYSCVDTDGDGIPNHLDLDSDNDGCPDAIEGGASITTTVASGGTLQGGNTGATSGTYNQPILLNLGTNTVNANGVPQLPLPLPTGYSNTTGQSVNTSQTANTVITTITAGTSQTINSGVAPSAITLTGSTTGVGIQWQVSTDNVAFTNITPAATGTSYSPGTLTATRYYRALLTSAGGCTTTTNVVTITVVPIAAVICSEPTTYNYQTIANGAWNATSTWQGGNVPTGSNQNILITHNVTYSGNLQPASGTTLVIKSGATLSVSQNLELKSSNTKLIVKDAFLNVGQNFILDSSGSSICAINSCFDITENLELITSNNVYLENTGIRVRIGNLDSSANVTGSNIKLWVMQNMNRNGGTWAGSTITQWYAGGNMTGFTGLPTESASTFVPCSPNVCYERPTDLATLKPVKHGISVLGRAGKTGVNGNVNDWPMVRNSAYTALEGKTKGFVITRIANPETAITDPKIGMMVFDTDADAGKGCLKINTTGTSTGWKCFTKQSCP